MKENSLPYRADIDGLRGFAVIAVVIYHIFPQWLPGGFIGVDIFFVISGYLITKIILNPLREGTFSFADFYRRRCRRLLPSLLTVILGVTALAPFVLFADEFKTLCKHILGGLSFVANFVLIQEIGYFDVAADQKPLLHLWSLAIEEQFYLVWPLALWLIFKSKRNPKLLIATLLLMSFGSYVFLGKHPSSFFNPLTRFWEIMAGCLLALLPDRKSQSKSLFSDLGFIGIFSSLLFMFLWNPEATYGVWAALIPVLTAALVIWNHPHSLSNRILADPTLVFFGLISYPLYLWHWPLFSFATLSSYGSPSDKVRYGILGLSVALATITYFFIEKPIRSRPALSFKPYFAVVSVCVLFFSIFPRYLKFNPMPESANLTLDSRSSATCLLSHQSSEKPDFCYSDSRETPNMVVWGDSKAAALYWGLVKESLPGSRWMVMAKSRCALADGKDTDCTKLNKEISKLIINDPNIKWVLLVFGYHTLFEYQDDKWVGSATKEKFVEEVLLQTIDDLQKAGKKVAFFLDHPNISDIKFCVPRLISLNEIPGCKISLDEHFRRFILYTSISHKLLKAHPDLLIYDPTPTVCDMIKKECSVSLNGLYLYSDKAHFSNFGASLVARPLVGRISDLERSLSFADK